MRRLPNESVQCCVTSPPYWGLRDYGTAGQIGLEQTPADWVANIVSVFREVRRLLKPDGTCWINLGDSYAADAGTDRKPTTLSGSKVPSGWSNRSSPLRWSGRVGLESLKPKDLVGAPWMVAFALRADGWYLRQDIIWSKPNPMPESVRDRCTKAHEYLFLLSKSERYFYDADAIREDVSGTAHARGSGVNPKARWKTPDGWDTSAGAGGHGNFHRQGREDGKRGYEHKKPRSKQNESFSAAVNELVDRRNKRSVWTVGTFGFPEAHFATYPPALITPCILAGTRVGDVVLDPFAGSGTTGQVAIELGRKAVLIELNPDYVQLIERRCNVTPGLPLVA